MDNDDNDNDDDNGFDGVDEGNDNADDDKGGMNIWISSLLFHDNDGVFLVKLCREMIQIPHL